MTTDILNLPKWDVIELEEGHDEYIITARYTVQPSVCPSCGVMFPRLHRYGTKQQQYRDLPIHGKKVLLVVVRKKWKCLECTKTFFEHLDDLDDHHRATKRLVSWVQAKALERPFTHLAAEIGVDEGTIRYMFNRHVDDLEGQIIFETPRWLGVDEIHLLGKPRCVFVNLEANTLIDMLEGRKGTAVARRIMDFKDREKIELVAIDMWFAYRDAIKGVLPNTVIVVDKFHVLRMANEGIDNARKRVREGLTDRQRRTLMHDRFLLFRRRRELPPDKAMILATWLDNFPDLAAAYEAKEAIYDLWDSTTSSSAAKQAYAEWLEAAQATGVAWAYSELIRAIGNWSTEVFAYFDHRVTNAATESLNNLTRLTNRMGRGYSFKAIRAKMLYSIRNRRPLVVRETTPQDELTALANSAIAQLLKGMPLDQLVIGISEFVSTSLESTYDQMVEIQRKHRDSTHNSE